MIKIEVNNLDEAYRKGVHLLTFDGEKTFKNGVHYTNELHNVCFVINNPRDRDVLCKKRRMFGNIQRADLCNNMLCTNNYEPLLKYMPNFGKYVIDRYESYGFIWSNQVINIIDKIKKDPLTRQATISIYNNTDTTRNNDVHCTLSLSFSLRHGKLNLTVVMRSNDAKLGSPIDMFTFTILQELIANELNVDVGIYTHIALNYHIYAKDIDESYNTMDMIVHDSHIERIKSCNIPTKLDKNTTYSNFWKVKDPYIFGFDDENNYKYYVDYQHFIHYLKRNIL